VWEEFISLISVPQVSSLLLSIGVGLVILELLITGFQGYVIAGALMILAALYAMSVVPLNIFTLLVMVLGVVLLIIEVYTPGFWAFGVVYVSGEEWTAYSVDDEVINVGERIVVVDVDGLKLRVRRKVGSE